MSFFLAKYGVQTTFMFPMVKRGVVDLAVTADWTPAAADSAISKDAGSFVDTTNTVAAVGGTPTRGATGWKITLTATELTAATVDLQIIDAATKVVEDQFIKIYTYGNASAKIPLDLSVNLSPLLPSALVGGRIDASVGAIAANAITATAINADAITAVKVADGTIDAATFAAGAINAAAIADGAIDAAAMAADMSSYTTRTWVGKQGTTADKYVVQWVKNGQVITSGITVPLIRVFKWSDGTNLIAETAMTEIGSTQAFKFSESTNVLTAGDVYIVEVKATIDGSVRLDRQPVMRDST